MNRAVVVVAIGTLALAGAGGGWFLHHRNADPLRRGEMLAEQGDLRGAQVELRNALRSQPDSADAHLRMARLQMKLADPVSAEKEFRTANRLGTDRWIVIPELGEAMIAQGHNRETLTQVPPRGPTAAITAKNLLLRSVAQLALQDLPAAAATLAEAEKTIPDQVEVLIIAARLAAAHNDFALTEAKVDEALRRDPTQIDALLMKERLLTAQNQRPAALAIADRAVRSAPWSAMAHMNRANQLIFANEDAKAQEDVNAVLSVQPRFSEAIYLNGVLMARRGKFQDAALELAKLDTSVGRFPQAVYYEAMVAAQLGQVQSAAEFARRYNALVPADPDGRRLLARTEIAAGRPEAALPVLQKAVLDGQNDPDTLDLLGRAHAAMGNAPAAVQAFSQAVGAAPDNAAILAHLGIAQLQGGQTGDATTTLERSFAMAPQMPSAGEALVSAALGIGDLAKAEAALAKLRAEVGDTEAVGVLTALVKIRKADFEGARLQLVATLRAFPNSNDAKLTLARVVVQQGHRAQGLALMNEILAKQPNNIQVLNSYLTLLAQDNDLPPAIQALENARKADPRQPVFTAMLADALTAVGNAPRTVAMLTEAAASESLPPVLMGPLARAQIATGHANEAKTTYRELLRAAPADLIGRSALVELLMRDREFDAAKAVLREGLAAVPGNFRLMSALLILELGTNGLDPAMKLAVELRRDPAAMPLAALLKGDLLIRARRPAEAAQAFLAEFKAGPTPQLLMRLSAAYAAAGQDDAATAQLRAWLADHPDTLEAAQELAKLDIKAHRLDDAQAHLGLVLARRPNDALALNNLAWTYYLAGDGRARATAQKAYLQAPTADTGDTLGWIMVKESAAKAAVPLLQGAAKERPNDPAIRYHLAVALSDDGQAAEATKLLKVLVASTDSFEERTAATQLLARLQRN